MKLLINAGASIRGFSRIGLAKYCLQAYAYRYRLAAPAPMAPPLIKGGLVHVGQAHLNRRLQALQQGDDPERWYAPDEAVELAASIMDDEAQQANVYDEDSAAWRYVPIAHRAMEAYLKAYGTEGEEVIAVEEELRVEILPLPKSGAIARPMANDEPLEDGRFYYSGRMDLLLRRGNRLVVRDHKSTSAYKVSVHNGTLAAFGMHGQFWGLRAMVALHAKAGRWGPEVAALGHPEVEVQVLDLTQDRIVRGAPAPAPWAEAHHWEDVLRWERIIADLEAETAYGDLDYWRWPRLGTENGCMTRYGRCPFWALCQDGPNAHQGAGQGFTLPRKSKR